MWLLENKFSIVKVYLHIVIAIQQHGYLAICGDIVIYETPVLPNVERNASLCNCALVENIIQKARQAGRTILTEFESKEILAAYAIPVVAGSIAKSAEEAVQCAENLGYPVVLKLYSQTITHKTDVGGVQLNLRN